MEYQTSSSEKQSIREKNTNKSEELEQLNIKKYLYPDYPWNDDSDECDQILIYKKNYITSYLNQTDVSCFLDGYSHPTIEQKINVYLFIYKLNNIGIKAKIFNTKYGIIGRFEPTSEYTYDTIMSIYKVYSKSKINYFIPKNFENISNENFEYKILELNLFMKKLKLPGYIISNSECGINFIFISFDEYSEININYLNSKWSEFTSLGISHKDEIPLEYSYDIIRNIPWNSRITLEIDNKLEKLLITHTNDKFKLSLNTVKNFSLFKHNLNLNSEMAIIGYLFFITSGLNEKQANVNVIPLVNYILYFDSQNKETSKLIQDLSIEYEKFPVEEYDNFPTEGCENFTQNSFCDFTFFERLGCVNINGNWFSFIDIYRYIFQNSENEHIIINKKCPLTRIELQEHEFDKLRSKFKLLETYSKNFISGIINDKPDFPKLKVCEVKCQNYQFEYFINFILEYNGNEIVFWTIPKIEDDVISIIQEVLLIKWTNGRLFRANVKHEDEILLLFTDEALSLFCNSLRNKWSNDDYKDRLKFEINQFNEL